MQKHRPDPHSQNIEKRRMECAPFENNVNYPAPHGSLIQQGMGRLEQTHGVHGAKHERTRHCLGAVGSCPGKGCGGRGWRAGCEVMEPWNIKPQQISSTKTVIITTNQEFKTDLIFFFMSEVS